MPKRGGADLAGPPAKCPKIHIIPPGSSVCQHGTQHAKAKGKLAASQQPPEREAKARGKLPASQQPPEQEAKAKGKPLASQQPPEPEVQVKGKGKRKGRGKGAALSEPKAAEPKAASVVRVLSFTSPEAPRHPTSPLGLATKLGLQADDRGVRGVCEKGCKPPSCLSIGICMHVIHLHFHALHAHICIYTYTYTHVFACGCC